MATWFLLIGGLLVTMAFFSPAVQRLPLSPAMLYLGVGLLIGPAGAGLLAIDAIEDSPAITVAAEVAVLVTLFAVGMRLHGVRAAWRVPVRLASLAMILTIGLAACFAVLVLQLPWPWALLLAAILAPTDPVLASDVQIRESGQRDAVRFALTAEGGLNDGAAFPAVLLALGLIGAHVLGSLWWRWWLVDVAWAISGGLAIGWFGAKAVAYVLLRQRRQPLQYEEFLVLGVIALIYGLALTLKTYGFLAVFAAGLGLARSSSSVMDTSTVRAPSKPARQALSERLLAWSGQAERLLEVFVVVLIGALAGTVAWSWQLLAFAFALILLVRPVSVWITVRRHELPHPQRRLAAWFGIRGIGSLYYLSFALDYGVRSSFEVTVASATLVAITVSIVVHGTSATPLMQWYAQRKFGKP